MWHPTWGGVGEPLTAELMADFLIKWITVVISLSTDPLLGRVASWFS